MDLVTNFYRTREPLRKLMRRLADITCDRVLDVGCQKGDITRTWRKPRQRIAAIDVRGWDEWAQAEPHISFALATATRLPFRDACFDLVIASESLQYVSDPEGAIDENRRVLAPGGRMLLSFPHGAKLHNWLDPYNLIHLAKRLLRITPGPGEGYTRHLATRRVLDHCREDWQVEQHFRRGSLMFIYAACAIGKLQVMRLALQRRGHRWLSEGVMAPFIKALFLVMQLDFQLRLGALSYNNIILLRRA